MENLTREEKRKAREEKRLAKKQAILQMQEDQTDDIDDLIDDLGIEEEDVVRVTTDIGIVACKKADPHEIVRFNGGIERMSSPSKKKRKGGSVSYDDLVQGLVKSCRIYPDVASFDKIMGVYPYVYNTLAEAILDLSGAGFEADVRKN